MLPVTALLRRADAAAVVVSALSMMSPLYDGPLARALGGMDLSWVLGFPVAGGLYLLLPATGFPLRTSR